MHSEPRPSSVGDEGSAVVSVNLAVGEGTVTAICECKACLTPRATLSPRHSKPADSVPSIQSLRALAFGILERSSRPYLGATGMNPSQVDYVKATDYTAIGP